MKQPTVGKFIAQPRRTENPGVRGLPQVPNRWILTPTPFLYTPYCLGAFGTQPYKIFPEPEKSLKN
jgi:hypothetical protein